MNTTPLENKPLLSNSVYDKLVWVALYGLPSLGTLYFALSQIWGLPYGPEVVGSITAIDTALGALLGFSKKSYNASDSRYDGSLMVDTSDKDVNVLSLEVNSPSEELFDKKELAIKVENSN